tara:strand:- start:901 stop:1140 length:240 start_codon:yes stop_codon:yes gene_type:complete
MSISFTGFFDEMVKIGSVHWTNVDFVDETEKTAAPMVPFEGDAQTSAKVKPLKKIKGKGRKAGIKKLMKSLGPGEGANV